MAHDRPSASHGCSTAREATALADDRDVGGTVPLHGAGAREYAFVQELVRAEAGIVLDAQKVYLVNTRMAALARAESLTLPQLYGQAMAGQASLRRRIVEAMTTNETSFYRDPAIFRALIREVIPHLLEQAPDGPIRVWCGACSTGQEPYSLAMGLREVHPQQADRFRIVATDLDSDALARARSGEYSQLEVNRGLPATSLVRFFEKRDLRWHLRPEVREMVEFRELNLVRPLGGLGMLDLILLRNVLIYFDGETKHDVLRRCLPLLQPHGLLVLGSTESLLGHQLPLTSRSFGRCTAYRIAELG